MEKAVPGGEAHSRDHRILWDHPTTTPIKDLQRKFSAPYATLFPDSFLTLFRIH